MWCMFCMSYVSSRAPLGVDQVEGGVLFGTWWARGCAGVFGRERGLLCWWIICASVRYFAGEGCVCRAGVGVGVSVRAVVVAPSCSLLFIFFCVEGKKGC